MKLLPPGYTLALSLALSLAFASTAFAAEEAVDASRFEITPLASNLMRPMELAVAPDGSVFYIELDGKLKCIDPKTRAISLVAELKVTTDQENGLIGLALDPQFATNRWIYLQYSPPDFSGQHISRFTLVDGKLDLASEKLLLKYEEQRKECCHHAGSLEFGPGGELFIATGDNTHPGGDSQGYAPIDERPDRAPFDAQKSSANTHSYNGKILRIKPTPDGKYEIPEGNLFPRDGSQGRPEIYVMGCRNPWRINVDSKTGFVYWGEVGPDAGGDGPRGPRGYDEINQARKAGNFGWPYFIANNQAYHDVDFATGKIGDKYDVNGPANHSPNNTGSKILPPPQPALIYYPYGDSAEFPELGKGGRTACAGPVYHHADSSAPNRFPAAYDGALFIYEWSRNWIKVVHLDADQKVKRIEPFLPEQRFVRPIDMEFGPDGALYMIEYGETWGVNQDARLVRIDYVRGNRAPIVAVSAENNIGKQPLPVKFSSQGTFDKDAQDKLTYQWRLTNTRDDKALPATLVVSREANPTITFNDPGVYNMELVVSDEHGASSAASLPVLVGNERPTIRFVQPRTGDFYDPEQPIAFKLHVNDAEDGNSDADEADEKDHKVIDSDSVTRVTLQATFSTAPVPSENGAAPTTPDPAGLALMKRSDCFNCHAVDQKRVGPQLLEIANKYRGQKDALEASVQRVLKGSTGVWGKIPMIPHAQHTPAEVAEMVGWVYSLQPSGAAKSFNGYVGEIPTAKEANGKSGHYKLEASYTDRGLGDIPPLSTSAVLFLRPRLIEAEAADEIKSAQILGGSGSSNNQFIGAINHNAHLRFNALTLDRVQKLTFRVTSAGAGGTIEVRQGKPDGPLLGSTEVEVNGAWDKWYDRTVDLQPTTGQHDLYIRFVNTKQGGGLMNLDSIYFHP